MPPCRLPSCRLPPCRLPRCPHLRAVAAAPLSSDEVVAALAQLSALDAATQALSDRISAHQGDLNARRAELATAAAARVSRPWRCRPS